MEPDRTIFEKLSPNMASLIAQFLNFKDLLSLGMVSRHLRTIFYEFNNSWLAVMKNYNLPESLITNLKPLDDFKDIFKQKVIKLGNCYIKLGFATKSWLIFPASEIPYDWKGSEYWPLEAHKDSWFGDTPIPHLKSVCWFKMYGEFVIPRGKYSLNFRICADKTFNLEKSFFYLDRDGCPEHMLKFAFTEEVENNLKKEVGCFTILKLGEFDLSDYPEKEVKVLLGSQHGNDWWKHGFWFDAVIFMPI
jgi:hypothetical protein